MTTIGEALSYARLLGCVVVVRTFEAGQTLNIAHGSGADMTTWRGVHEWGDDEAALALSLVLWLNRLPWTTEDDPRVEEEGAYL